MKTKAEVLAKAKELKLNVPKKEHWMTTRKRVKEALSKAGSGKKSNSKPASGSSAKNPLDQLHEILPIKKEGRKPVKYVAWSKKGRRVTHACTKQEMIEFSKELFTGTVESAVNYPIVRKRGLIRRLITKGVINQKQK